MLRVGFPVSWGIAIHDLEEGESSFCAKVDGVEFEMSDLKITLSLQIALRGRLNPG